MRVWIFCLLTLCLLPVQAAERSPAQIRIISEVWPGYTNADGSGLAWEIMRMIFEPAGVKVVHRSETYTRAVGLVQRGEGDAWLGSYGDEDFEHTLYPRETYALDPVTALGLADKPVPNLADIGTYRLAWMQGYGYQHYLPGVQRYQEVRTRSGVLEMLARDRADYYIDALPEVQHVLARSTEPARYRIAALTALPMYPGFADTASGRALAALYDRRLAALSRDGSLRALYQRWNQPYLFDDYTEYRERMNVSP